MIQASGEDHPLFRKLSTIPHDGKEDGEKEGIETELIQLSAKVIQGCIACYKCFENQDQQCAVKNDGANE